MRLKSRNAAVKIKATHLMKGEALEACSPSTIKMKILSRFNDFWVVS
jgi:hypothetical protein